MILTALGERNRGLYVLKSRGTAHSNQIREFLLSDNGMAVVPVVIGSNGVQTGAGPSHLVARHAAQLHVFWVIPRENLLGDH